jgi:hypothetical protein
MVFLSLRQARAHWEMLLNCKLLAAGPGFLRQPQLQHTGMGQRSGPSQLPLYRPFIKHRKDRLRRYEPCQYDPDCQLDMPL